MSIIYAMVAHGPTVLCDFRDPSRDGNFVDVSKKILMKIHGTTSRSKRHTYVCDGQTFNFKGLGNKFTVMCMAEERCGRRMPFLFLNAVEKSLMRKYQIPQEEDASYNIELSDKKVHEFQQFKEKLEEILKLHSKKPDEFDHINNVQRGLDEIKDVMIENIEKVMERGEAIESLVKRTDHLNFSSENFKKSSKKLHRSMFWANFKLKLITGIAVLFVLYIFVATLCGVDFSHC